MGEFTDRVVLVTGSSSGIGEQIARRFADLGASIVVNSSTSVSASSLGRSVSSASRATSETQAGVGLAPGFGASSA